MSNYYLCDTCEKKFAVDDPRVAISPYCQCEAHPELHPKAVMFDHHGYGGKRYDEPTDVCADFERSKS